MTGCGAVLTRPVVYGGTEHVLDAVPTSSELASLQQPCCFSYLGSLLANLSFVVFGIFTTLQPSPQPILCSLGWLMSYPGYVSRVYWALEMKTQYCFIWTMWNYLCFQRPKALNTFRRDIRWQAVCWPPGFSVCTTENLGPQKWLQSPLPTDLRPRDSQTSQLFWGDELIF